MGTIHPKCKHKCIVVSTPTHFEYMWLMHYYEKMGRLWRGDDKPTTKKELIRLGPLVVEWHNWNTGEVDGYFGYASQEFYEHNGWKAISYKEWKKKYYKK